MRSYAIAVIAGDGIGPEVMRASQLALEAAADSFTIDWISYPYGSAHYLKTGEALPERGLAEISRMDAVYLGTFGSPKLAPGVIEKRLLGKLRSSLGQYAFLRPVKLLPGVKSGFSGAGTGFSGMKPKDVDFFIVRENSEDAYAGAGGLFWKSTPGEMAVQAGVISRKGCEKIMDYAFWLAKSRGKALVTSCDRADLMMQSHGLWRKVFCEIASKHKRICAELSLAGDLIAEIPKNPGKFGVIVAPNTVGDVLSEVSAILQGGRGMSYAAEVNPKGVSSFKSLLGFGEAKGKSNPIGLVLAGAMMFESLGEKKAAERVRKAVGEVLEEGRIRTRDIGGKAGTEQVAEAIAREIG